MPKLKIDGVEYEFTPGETIIQVADRNGIDIPRFCYHPALSVVAQCRMCAVEVEKMPKMQTACSTPCADNMVVYTKSEKVKAMQASVMEFLLINHPLDCPICDESGECDLQNYSYLYGNADSRYEEQRRTYVDLDMGPVIKKNMNRCIHCTRCIRFCDEVSGYREMIALQRGNFVEITTQDGKPLMTDYAGNLADICPTGSLTLKDFRFKKRVWFLKKTPSVCEGCSQGCNNEIHTEDEVIYRTKPRENMEINKYWLCDEGRFLFHHVHSESRIVDPTIKSKSKPTDFEKCDWSQAIQTAKKDVQGKVLFLIGSDLTMEEILSIKNFAHENFKDFYLCHYGTPGVETSAQDKPEDKLLRRTSKTSNLHGVEKLGIPPFKAEGSFDSAFVFRGGRAVIPQVFKKIVKGYYVGVGVFNEEQVSGFEVILPGLSWAEKSGTIVNWQNKEQKINKAIEPVGQSKSVQEIFEMWRNEI
jgi:NADH-quinone oxidoreductase subunit G